MRPSSIVFLNDFCIRYIQSGIESLATHGASECDGGGGKGEAYISNCIHSGIITINDNLATNWYNYVLASAGTIVNKDIDDATTVLNTATESICPKGWSLPSYKQIDNNRDIANFNPVLGGYYSNGTLYDESTTGNWWGSEAYSGLARYFLVYNGSGLYTRYYFGRSYGLYIRCVSEKKTVTDLTYMQDMTPEITNKTVAMNQKRGRCPAYIHCRSCPHYL